MGWNQLHATCESRLLQGISPDAHFYFAHSYAAAHSGEETVATCEHGNEFTAVLEHNNLFGVQFHPEKSGEPGAQLLQNFLKVAA
jgi:glutamine amidotransferase